MRKTATSVYLTDQEREFLAREAAQAGMSLSAYLRTLIQGTTASFNLVVHPNRWTSNSGGTAATSVRMRDVKNK